MRSMKLLAAFFAGITLSACGGRGVPRGVAMPDTAFKDEISVANPPARMKPGETVVVDVTVRNLGEAAWPHEGEPGHLFSVLFAYHWLRPDGSVAVFDGIRTGLPRDLPPGGAATLKATVQAPPNAGKYVLEFDLVQESVSWFKDRGTKAPRFDVTVE